MRLQTAQAISPLHPSAGARRGYQLGLPQTKLLASVVLPLPL